MSDHSVQREATMVFLNAQYMPDSDLEPIGAMDLLRTLDVSCKMIWVSFLCLPHCTAISAQPT